MFEKFTDRARTVMTLAQQEAKRFNHEYIGTEHLLLGVCKEGGGIAAIVLKNLNVGSQWIRLAIEKQIKSGPDMITDGKLPLTPRAQKVIEYMIEEARFLNHDYVDTAHLLLGLLREQDGIASQVLRNFKLTVEIVREEILNVLVSSDTLKAPRMEVPSLAEQSAEETLLDAAKPQQMPEAKTLADAYRSGYFAAAANAIADAARMKVDGAEQQLSAAKAVPEPPTINLTVGQNTSSLFLEATVRIEDLARQIQQGITPDWKEITVSQDGYELTLRRVPK